MTNEMKRRLIQTRCGYAGETVIGRMATTTAAVVRLRMSEIGVKLGSQLRLASRVAQQMHDEYRDFQW